jgi:hypothetical protein
MDTLSSTLHHIVFHPLFTILLFLCLVGLLGGIAAVWVRMGNSDATGSSPTNRSSSIQEKGQLRAARPGPTGR